MDATQLMQWNKCNAIDTTQLTQSNWHKAIEGTQLGWNTYIEEEHSKIQQSTKCDENPKGNPSKNRKIVCDNHFL